MAFAVRGGRIHEGGPLIERDPKRSNHTLSVVLNAEFFNLINFIPNRYDTFLDECDLTELVKLIDDHKPLLVEYRLQEPQHVYHVVPVYDIVPRVVP